MGPLSVCTMVEVPLLYGGRLKPYFEMEAWAVPQTKWRSSPLTCVFVGAAGACST